MTTDGGSIFISFEKHRGHRETISFSTSFKSQWSGIIHYFQMDGISRNEWALSCMLYNPGALQLCAHESARRENTTTTTKKNNLTAAAVSPFGFGFWVVATRPLHHFSSFCLSSHFLNCSPVTASAPWVLLRSSDHLLCVCVCACVHLSAAKASSLHTVQTHSHLPTRWEVGRVARRHKSECWHGLSGGAIIAV